MFHARTPEGATAGRALHVDLGADWRGHLLEKAAADNSVAPDHANAGSVGRGSVQALSVRRAGEDRAISRTRHLPAGRLTGLLHFLPREGPCGRSRVAVIALGIAGLVLLAEDFRHPYRAIYDHQAREFARRFWPDQARSAELACLNWDFGLRRPHTAGARTALYLCNQHIYSPSRRQGAGPIWASVTSDGPLRCMAFDNRVFIAAARGHRLAGNDEQAIHPPRPVRNHLHRDRPKR